MIFLGYHRMLYDQGHRTPDPDEIHARRGGQPVMPIAGEHLQNHLSRLAEGVSMDTLLRVIGRKK
jgi:hypothetical protein